MKPKDEQIKNERLAQPSGTEPEAGNEMIAAESNLVFERDAAPQSSGPEQAVPSSERWGVRADGKDTHGKKISLYEMVAIGLMAAVVFVVTMFLSIRIPTPTGTVMIKLANAFILLSGLLLGGWRGGLAAGFGSMIFDLMTPEYVPEAWITFVRFFLMAYICGAIAHGGGAKAKNWGRNLFACIVSAVFSSVFYAAKNILVLMFGGSAFIPAFTANIPKLITSVPNTLIAVFVAMALLPAMQKALSSTSFGQRVQMQH